MDIKTTLLDTQVFIDNEYLDKYTNLILANKDTISTKYVTQKHHIIPVNVFKHLKIEVDNSEDNIVILRYSDHILAHYYLCFCVKDTLKFVNEFAFLSLWNEKRGPYNEEELKSILPGKQKLYEDYCLRKSQLTTKRLLGHSTSEETRKRISDSAIGRYSGDVWIHRGNERKHIPQSELKYYLNLGFEVGRNDIEVYRKISEIQKANPNRAMLGKKQSDKQKQVAREYMSNRIVSDITKANMSKARQGKILISNKELNKSFYIFPEELSDYLSKGFYKGRLNK